MCVCIAGWCTRSPITEDPTISWRGKTTVTTQTGELRTALWAPCAEFTSAELLLTLYSNPVKSLRNSPWHFYTQHTSHKQSTSPQEKKNYFSNKLIKKTNMVILWFWLLNMYSLIISYWSLKPLHRHFWLPPCGVFWCFAFVFLKKWSFETITDYTVREMGYSKVL